MTHKDTKEHKAEPSKAEPKHSTKHVHMQKGTDEVNHGTTSYPVPKDGHVDLPAEVAGHVIRQGGAEDLTPKPEPLMDLVEVQNPSNPSTTLGWGGELYKVDKDGKTKVPIAALEDVAPHGFLLC